MNRHRGDLAGELEYKLCAGAAEDVPSGGNSLDELDGWTDGVPGTAGQRGSGLLFGWEWLRIIGLTLVPW